MFVIEVVHIHVHLAPNRRPRMCSAVYDTVHIKEPLKSSDKNGRDFGLYTVAILS